MISMACLSAVTMEAAEPSCPDLHSAVQIAITQKKNLEKKGEELQVEFDRYVAADVQDQANDSGSFMADLNRNAAKKALFAKKRLKEAIFKKERTIGTLSEIYCKRCPPSAEINKQEFCLACPEAKLCEAPDL